ncbi:MAG: tRNA lysidine(34) synthetase TilS, partial [Mameliella sp.]|nr:tRNA lysidine(34) synthetase TilS [Phaeodactylibacter sp.]
LKLSFGIAHCNFRLRGAASDADATFVQRLAEELNVVCHLTSFNTLQEAEVQSVSVQMAARSLRYNWFEELRSEEGYDYIVTAHHLSDAIETVIFNLTRGTGIKGLSGIPQRNGYVIRPLLQVGHAQLTAYQEAHQIAFREDQSNAETKYTRNYIRHKVIPLLQGLNPGIERTMKDNLQRFQQSAYLMEEMVKVVEAHSKSVEGNRTLFELEAIRSHSSAVSTLVFELLSSFGLNNTQANDLAEAILTKQSGKLFLTETHEVYLSARLIEVTPKISEALVSLIIKKGERSCHFSGGQLTFTLRDQPPEYFPADRKKAFFDFEALTFPLGLRTWKEGDWFQPFGMEGKRQKLQDYFSNSKFSRGEKAKTLLLTDAKGRIAWIVGHRSSHPHRIRANSSKCWSVEVRYD